MTASAGFVELLKDALSGLGPVSVRRMFGGAGVYADGVMFGLVADDTLYLKADDDYKARLRGGGARSLRLRGARQEHRLCPTGARLSAFSTIPRR